MNIVTTWVRQHRRLAFVLAAATVYGCVRYLTGDGERSAAALGSVGFFGSIAIGVVTMEGAASAREFVARQRIVLAVVITMCALLAALGVGVGALTVLRAVQLCGGAMVGALLAAAIAGALSAWKVPRAGMFAAIVIIGSVSLAAGVASSTSPVARAILLAEFPIDAIATLSGGSSYAPGLAQPILTLLGHFAFWYGVALAGFRVKAAVVPRTSPPPAVTPSEGT